MMTKEFGQGLLRQLLVPTIGADNTGRREVLTVRVVKLSHCGQVGPVSGVSGEDPRVHPFYYREDSTTCVLEREGRQDVSLRRQVDCVSRCNVCRIYHGGHLLDERVVTCRVVMEESSVGLVVFDQLLEKGVWSLRACLLS